MISSASTSIPRRDIGLTAGTLVVITDSPSPAVSEFLQSLLHRGPLRRHDGRGRRASSPSLHSWPGPRFRPIVAIVPPKPVIRSACPCCPGNLRVYQFVPLLMALRLNPVRLLIADDVGVGKTIEALLVARELLDRGDMKRICVRGPPCLCEQWQKELAEKFNLEAVVFRAGTVGHLDR